MNLFSLRNAAAVFTSSVLFFSQADALNPYPRSGYGAPQMCCNQFWIDAEYLYWGIKDTRNIVPLITQGPTSVPSLGTPDVTVILGSERIKTDWRSGFKISAGYWLDSAQTFGIEANYQFLPSLTNTASVSSSGLPDTGFIGVPYFDVTTLAENAYRVSNSNPIIDDGAYSGFASYKNRNSIQGAELNIWTYGCDEGYEIGLLTGFRYWNFDEKFTFATSSPFLTLPDDIFKTKDQFNIQNNFYGGQLGVGIDCSWDCFSFDLEGKIAFGATNGRVNILGSLLTNEFNTVPSTGTPLSFVGGIFALPTNIGSHTKWFFAVIPEVNVSIGYQLMSCVKFNLGYSFLAVSKLIRAAEQINRNLNLSQAPASVPSPVAELAGPESPNPIFVTRGFWAQGINAGVELSF